MGYDVIQSVAIINTLPFLILILLLFFLRANWRYEVQHTMHFMPPTLCLMIEIVVENLDYFAFEREYCDSVCNFLHKFVVMVGHDVRILLMSFLVAIVADRMTKGNRTRFWTILPAVINTIVMLPCLFTDFYFWYDEKGNFHYGILGIEPHLLAIAYVGFLIALSFMAYQRGRRTETGILTILTFSVVVAVLVETLFSLKGILLGVTALSIMGYYLYTHIEHFRYDKLTGILNREALSVDIEKYTKMGMISHVLSIDMNGLKRLNDELGHNAGDKALIIIATVLSYNRLSKTMVYRVGGDEFTMICLNKKTIDIISMIKNIQRSLENEGYSCAIGYAEWQKGKTFEEIYQMADATMYDKKRRMKQIEEEGYYALQQES